MENIFITYALCSFMDLIPLIYMKNRKIHLEDNDMPVPLDEFLKKIEEEEKIYILDLDGIERDKPNLCTYQRIPDSYEVWVDFGPRDLGDIVDATMAGANNIVLRKELCPQLFVADIREISENKIYGVIDFDKDLPFDDSDGLVNFNNREKIEENFKHGDFFKRNISKNKIFSYELELKNLSYWKEFGVEGLLVDVNKLKEFKNGV